VNPGTRTEQEATSPEAIILLRVFPFLQFAILPCAKPILPREGNPGQVVANTSLVLSGQSCVGIEEVLKYI